MNVIARLPDCAGQAVDAVSAYIQVKIEDLQNCSKFRSQDVQTQNGPNHGQTLKICGSTSSTKFLRSSASRIVMERQFEEVPMELGWEKVQNLECLFVHRKQGWMT